MTSSETPISDFMNDLREQIAEAIRHWHSARATICEHTQVISFGEAADAVMGVIEDEAIDRMAEQFVAETRLRSMDFRNGFAMDVEASRTLVANWVGAARGMLGDAENYSETPITMTVKVAEDPEQFVFTLQRAGKLTPHQARQAAEAEVERLAKELGEANGALSVLAVIAQHGDMSDATRREMLDALNGDRL